jgi:hypothetical protein
VVVSWNTVDMYCHCLVLIEYYQMYILISLISLGVCARTSSLSPKVSCLACSSARLLRTSRLHPVLRICMQAIHKA